MILKKLTKFCKICNKKFQTTNPRTQVCSLTCGAKLKSPIYKAFARTMDFKQLSQDEKKILKQRSKGHIFSTFKLWFPEYLEDLKEFWETHRICSMCGGIYRTPGLGSSPANCGSKACISKKKESIRAIHQKRTLICSNCGDPFEGIYSPFIFCDKAECQIARKLKVEGAKAVRHNTNLKIQGKDYRKIRGRKASITLAKRDPGLKKRNTKSAETNLRNLGCKSPLQNPEIKEQAKKTNIISYGWPYHQQRNYTNYENFTSQYILENFVGPNGILKEPEIVDYFNMKSIKPAVNLLKKNNVKFQRMPKGTRQQKYFFYDYLKVNPCIIEFEKTIKLDRGKKYRVDGFIAPNTIIEFLGDYWHGYSNDNALNEKTQLTAAELHSKTFERFADLTNSGYEIQYIWESEYSKTGLPALKILKPFTTKYHHSERFTNPSNS